MQKIFSRLNESSKSVCKEKLKERGKKNLKNSNKPNEKLFGLSSIERKKNLVICNVWVVEKKKFRNGCRKLEVKNLLLIPRVVFGVVIAVRLPNSAQRFKRIEIWNSRDILMILLCVCSWHSDLVTEAGRRQRGRWWRPVGSWCRWTFSSICWWPIIVGSSRLVHPRFRLLSLQELHLQVMFF